MSLAIAEKQQKRPAGCAGILFQLWDWNRRLAKKKIFSRKLLPPVRPAKMTVKKFGEDDKMPIAKLLLIADENRGGFRIPKKPEAHEPYDGMRAPGLVARLMGLESMPVVAHEKPRKAMDSGPLDSKGRASSEIPRLDQDLCRESSGLGKFDSRPPKLQKTGGFLERRQMDGGGLQPNVQLKNTSTHRSRSKHHKLPSPVMSPRLLSGRHRARLMHAAATKILEPGLQSRSIAQRAITYTDSSRDAAKMNDEDFGCSSKSKISKRFSHDSVDSVLESSIRYSLFEESQSIEKVPTEVEIGSSTSRPNDGTLFGNAYMHSGLMPLEKQKEEYKKRPMVSRVKFDSKKYGNDFVEKLTRKEMYFNKPKREGMPMSIRDDLRQNQLSEVKDKVAFGSKIYSRKPNRKDVHEPNGLRGISPARRIFNDHTRGRSESEVINNHRAETSIITLEKSVSRKRAITNTCNEHAGNKKITFAKEENSASHLIHKKSSKKCTNIVLKRESNDSSEKKDGSIVSFSFNSLIRGSTRSCSYEELAENKIDDVPHFNPSFRRRLPMAAKSNDLQSPRNLSEGEISYLLEGKIRELTSLDQVEFGARDAQSTAEILQELLTSFTSGAPLPVKNIDKAAVRLGPPKIDDLCAHGTELCDSPREAKTCAPAALVHVENDQHSPISILETSFSNDSCSIRSSDTNSDGKLQSNLDSCNTISHDMDADLVDSATSVDIADLYNEMPYSSERSLSKPVMQLRKVGQPRVKLHEVNQAVSNAELLLQNIVLYGSNEKLQCPLYSFLQDLLKVILDELLEKDDLDYRAMESSKVNLLKECTFDCIIQSLNSKYECLSMGYESCPKLPLLLTEDWLRREVHKEVKEWVGLAGLDNLIENEVRNSSRKWMIYKKEALDASMEIQGDILKGLVDEMLMDFC